MNCPKCQTSNSDTSKFCQACGASLKVSVGDEIKKTATEHAKRIGNQARSTAESELHSGINNTVNKIIRSIMDKIFGR